MAQNDAYGNVLNTMSASARDHYDRGVRLFLGAEYGAVAAFEAALVEDPDFDLAHAALSRAWMMSGRMAEAKTALLAAQRLCQDQTGRAASHVAAMTALMSGQPGAARRVVYRHARDYPRDVMAVQMNASIFGLIGFSGETGREAQLLAYTTGLMRHMGEDWWMMSMHALALCEVGRLDDSAALMERSLEINNRNANASHFKSHAQYEAGQSEAGRAYLQDWLQGYDTRAVLYGHLSWHVALWALHAGDTDTMWAWADAHVGPDGAQGLPINVLTDTAALYHRAEIAGLEVAPERWRRLSDYAVQCFPETGQSFADMHAALAHAMAGDGARLDHIVTTAKGYAGDLIAPVARAWGLIARADWTSALAELTPILAVHERLGGSRAQRDLLEFAYLNVLMKLGQTDEAKRMLATRRPVFSAHPPVQGLP